MSGRKKAEPPKGGSPSKADPRKSVTVDAKGRSKESPDRKQSKESRRSSVASRSVVSRSSVGSRSEADEESEDERASKSKSPKKAGAKKKGAPPPPLAALWQTARSGGVFSSKNLLQTEGPAPAVVGVQGGEPGPRRSS